MTNYGALRIHKPYGIPGAEEVGGMSIVFLREGVLGEPAARGGVVAAGAEVIDVEGGGGVPILALVLFGLEGGGRTCRQGPAEGIVVIGLQGSATVVHQGADGAEMVADEVAPGRRASLWQHQIVGLRIPQRQKSTRNAVGRG